MMNPITRIVVFLLWFVITSGAAFAQQGCGKDILGRIYCAPAGGVAVSTINGVACAPGRCVTDNLGYVKCSRETGGGAIRDNLGNPVCVGGCVNPIKEYCQRVGD